MSVGHISSVVKHIINKISDDPKLKESTHCVAINFDTDVSKFFKDAIEWSVGGITTDLKVRDYISDVSLYASNHIQTYFYGKVDEGNIAFILFDELPPDKWLKFVAWRIDYYTDLVLQDSNSDYIFNDVKFDPEYSDSLKHLFYSIIILGSHKND
jgi:hypothetical protein